MLCEAYPSIADNDGTALYEFVAVIVAKPDGEEVLPSKSARLVVPGQR
jgi:hypothetical protein